ncbi:MAG TPA: toll/interleukin-1 receptor domain-containing protein [Caulobacteraceae bacterium]|jgi:uncharacterized membrane protein YgcG
MTASIFISYATPDQKVANTLCKALEGRGFPCWIASRDIQPGENFQIAIVRAIRAAKIMLLVFTGNSNNSDEMAKELALASQSKLIVVPLRIDDVKPNDAFSYEFATRQWIDFFADWETAIDQLAQRIAIALGVEATPVHAAVASAAPPEPPPPPPPAQPAPTPQAIAAAIAAPGVLEAASMPSAASASAATASPVDPLASGPSSFAAPAKGRAPVGLFIALGILVVALIGGAAVILPSFLAKKPIPPDATNAAVNTLLSPTAPLATQPVTAPPALPVPGPTASEVPVQPTNDLAEPPPPPEEPTDGDAQAQQQYQQRHDRSGRQQRHGGGGGGGGDSGGGGSVEVPF